jgi:ADP-heptose:LPS heptosyltransferase
LVGAVAGAVSVPCTDLAGRTSTEELFSLLAGAELVVAGDTGPLHVASALGTPVVGIFGPTDPTNTGPLAVRSEVVRLGIACSPCYDLRSPADCKLPDRSAACMWGLAPEAVLAAIGRVLGSGSTSETRTG